MFVKLVNDCGRNDNNIFPLKGKSLTSNNPKTTLNKYLESFD